MTAQIRPKEDLLAMNGGSLISKASNPNTVAKPKSFSECLVPNAQQIQLCRERRKMEFHYHKLTRMEGALPTIKAEPGQLS